MPSIDELQDRIAQLEDLLGVTAFLPMSAKLRERGIQRRDVRLLGMLMQRAFVPREVALDAIYGDNPPHRYAINTIVKRLKKSIKETGATIKLVWGEGYYIEPSDKQKLVAAWPELSEPPKALAA